MCHFKWKAGCWPINFRRSLPWLPFLGAALLLGSCEKLKEVVRNAKPAATPAAPLEGGVSRELNEGEFEKFINTPGRLSVVVFHADWCGPCRALAPVIHSVAGDFSTVAHVGRFNVDNNRELAGKLGVRGIPDVRFFRDGKQVDAFVGGRRESAVREKFDQHTRGLIPAAPPETPAPAAAGSGTPGGKDWLPPGMSRPEKHQPKEDKQDKPAAVKRRQSEKPEGKPAT